MKKLISWFIILLLNLPWISAFIFVPKEEYVQPAEVIEEEGALIRWTQEDIYEKESMEVSVELVELDETKEPQMQSLGVFTLTAYCPCTVCSDNWGTQTATGTVATEGRTVAVDPKAIPYGTILIINGREYVAEDCGSAIKGNDIDIYFESHKKAEEFGVKYTEIFIIKK